MGGYLPTLPFKRLQIYWTTKEGVNNSLILRIGKNIHSIPPMIYPLHAVYFQSCPSSRGAATLATAPHSGPCHARQAEKPRQPGAGD